MSSLLISKYGSNPAKRRKTNGVMQDDTIVNFGESEIPLDQELNFQA